MKLFHEICASTLNLPPGTFIYNLVSIKSLESALHDAQSFVAASSNNALTLFSLHGAPYRVNVHHSLQNVHSSISCLQLCQLSFNHDGPGQHIVTSGRDGRVKFWNLQNFDRASITLELRTPNGQGISAIAQSVVENTLAAGTELETDGPGDVAIYVWRISEFGGNVDSNIMQPVLSFTESHTDTITNVSFHVSSPPENQIPSNQQQSQRVVNLVTSSTDGLVNVFDVKQADEEEAVVSVVNTRSAVQYLLCINDSNGVFELSGHVCSISQDEKLAIYNLASADENERATGSEKQDWDIRETLNCDYAIALTPLDLKSESQVPNEGNVILAVGACKSETTVDPRVDLYVAPINSLGFQAAKEPAIRLCGAHGEEVVRDVWFREDCPTILSCGEDGHVRAWQAPNAHGFEKSSEVAHNNNIEHKSKKSSKHKRKENSMSRFKPY